MYNDEEEEEAEEEKEMETENIGYQEVDACEGGNSGGIDSALESNFFAHQSEEDRENENLSSAIDYQELAPQITASEEITIRSSKLALTIVDYDHDDTAMSPDNEVTAFFSFNICSKIFLYSTFY